jgi:hypothetical protein
MGFFDFLTGSKPAQQPTTGLVDAVRQSVAAQVDRIDLNRSEYRNGCDWVSDDLLHLQRARELEQVNKEYAAFVETDPAYINGLAVLLPIIHSTPGILQTDLYKACPGIERETISYILYFAASSGKIERTKKGRSYELRAK